MIARPVSLAFANDRVAEWHRHHKPAVGHRWSVGAFVDDECVGVAITGRPVARVIDADSVLEVTRVATNGHRNACSFLLGRIARIAFLMGFEIVQTYTLESESGASLRAAGWIEDHRTKGQQWRQTQLMTLWGETRNRTDQPTCDKIRWRRREIK